MLLGFIELLKNKVVSGVGAGGLVVSAEATKSGYIDLAEHGVWILSFASWMQIIGCLWISLLILEKIGIFKLVKFICGKIANGRKTEQ